MQLISEFFVSTSKKGKFMFKKYLVFIVFVVLVLISSAAIAQVPSGPGVPPPDLPIDSGLGILLAIGVGYAVNKLRKED